MAPTAQEIKRLIEVDVAQQLAATKKSGSTGKIIQPGTLANHFHDNVDFHINGHDFHLSTQLKGAEAVMAAEESLPEIPDVIDHSKPMDGKVLQVIGGGPQTDWAAAVLKSTATTVKGKPFNHEWVVTMQFDNDGKIVHFKSYADTLHLHNTLQGN